MVVQPDAASHEASTAPDRARERFMIGPSFLAGRAVNGPVPVEQYAPRAGRGKTGVHGGCAAPMRRTACQRLVNPRAAAGRSPRTRGAAPRPAAAPRTW